MLVDVLRDAVGGAGHVRLVERRPPALEAVVLAGLLDPLLDNSMVLFCSSMMTGNHNNDQLPVVLVGRGGGRIKTGRVLDYLGKPNRKMCSLYLSMMDKMGVSLDAFGDSKERLTEI